MSSLQQRLDAYLAAERRILQNQSVETAEGEKLTLANLKTVQTEIRRLTAMLANQSSGRRSIIRRNFLE